MTRKGFTLTSLRAASPVASQSYGRQVELPHAVDGRSGFTLIELILYTGITAIVVVALTRAMLTILGTRERIESVSSVQQELRFTMDRMTQAVRRARAIEVEKSLFGAPNGVLVLDMPETVFDSTVFALSGSHIVMSEGENALLPLTSDALRVDELFFVHQAGTGGVTLLKVRVHAQNAAPEFIEDEADEMTLETAVTLRQQ